MATQAQFDAAMANLNTQIAAVVAHIKDLQGKLSAGEPITDADIAALNQAASELQAAVPAP